MVYSMKCTCGHIATVDAENKEEAIGKMQDMMTDDAIAAHVAKDHAGEEAPTKAQVDMQVAQMIQEGDQEGPRMGE